MPVFHHRNMIMKSFVIEVMVRGQIIRHFPAYIILVHIIKHVLNSFITIQTFFDKSGRFIRGMAYIEINEIRVVIWDFI